jgi:hypothetical protein
VKAIDEIILGGIENLDCHDTRWRMSAMTCSHSEKRALSRSDSTLSLVDNL